MRDFSGALAIVALCGIGTYLLRLTPMLYRSGSDGGAASRFSGAVGPAAIAALFVAMLLPLLGTVGKTSITTVALLTTIIAQRMFGGVAMPTMLGTVAYGLLLVLRMS